MGGLDIPLVRDKDIHFSGHCAVIEQESHVIIARKLGHTPQKLSIEEELERRILAAAIHKEALPQYTQDYTFLLLKRDTECTAEVPILGRVIPKLNTVTPISAMTDNDIISNRQLCDALSVIYWRYLLVFFRKRVLMDTGQHGQFGSSLPTVLKKISRTLTTTNVMMGFDAKGKQQVFCDPDWFYKPHEYRSNVLLAITIYPLINGLRALFFRTVVTCHQVVFRL